MRRRPRILRPRRKNRLDPEKPLVPVQNLHQEARHHLASPIGDLALGEIPTGKMSEPGKDLAEIDLGDDTGEVNTPVEEIQEKEDKDGIPKPDQEEDAVDADSQSVENGHLSWILLILLIVTAGIGFLLILLDRRKREKE